MKKFIIISIDHCEPTVEGIYSAKTAESALKKFALDSMDGFLGEVGAKKSEAVNILNSSDVQYFAKPCPKLN